MSGHGQWIVNKGKLLVVAPPGMWGELKQVLSLRYPEIEFLPESGLDRTNYSNSVDHLAWQLNPDRDHLLIVAGKRRAAGNIANSFMPNGVPTGSLFANNTGDIRSWAGSFKKRGQEQGRTFAILSMWKDFYLKWANLYASALQHGYSLNGNRIKKWYADEISQDQIGANLAKGPSLAIYVGHGRSRGWSGYRGLRWHHIEQHPMVNPVGVLMSITCKNLLVEYNQVPFGVRWVMSGRAGTFMGAVHDVRINPLIKISNKFISLLRDGEYYILSDILRKIDREIKATGDREEQDCWDRFRLIGDPAGFF
jgi:hypothetical protein